MGFSTNGFNKLLFQKPSDEGGTGAIPDNSIAEVKLTTTARNSLKKSILNNYANEAALIADQGNQISGGLYSNDEFPTKIYTYLGSTGGVIADYRITGGDSLELATFQQILENESGDKKFSPLLVGKLPKILGMSETGIINTSIVNSQLKVPLGIPTDVAPLNLTFNAKTVSWNAHVIYFNQNAISGDNPFLYVPAGSLLIPDVGYFDEVGAGIKIIEIGINSLGNPVLSPISQEIDKSNKTIFLMGKLAILSTEIANVFTKPYIYGTTEKERNAPPVVTGFGVTGVSGTRGIEVGAGKIYSEGVSYSDNENSPNLRNVLPPTPFSFRTLITDENIVGKAEVQLIPATKDTGLLGVEEAISGTRWGWYGLFYNDFSNNFILKLGNDDDSSETDATIQSKIISNYSLEGGSTLNQLATMIVKSGVADNSSDSNFSVTSGVGGTVVINHNTSNLEIQKDGITQELAETILNFKNGLKVDSTTTPEKSVIDVDGETADFDNTNSELSATKISPAIRENNNLIDAHLKQTAEISIGSVFIETTTTLPILTSESIIDFTNSLPPTDVAIITTDEALNEIQVLSENSYTGIGVAILENTTNQDQTITLISRNSANAIITTNSYLIEKNTTKAIPELIAGNFPIEDYRLFISAGATGVNLLKYELIVSNSTSKGGGGETKSILNNYADGAALIADQTNQIEGGLYRLNTNPPQYYEYLGNSNSLITDYDVVQNGKTILRTYMTNSALFGDQANQVLGGIYKSREFGTARYVYLGTTNGNLTDYDLLSHGRETDKSIFQLDSTTKGFLPPRMNETERDAIVGLDATDEGLQIFNTDIKRTQTWDGVAWTETHLFNKDADVNFWVVDNPADGEFFEDDFIILNLTATTYQLKKKSFNPLFTSDRVYYNEYRSRGNNQTPTQSLNWNNIDTTNFKNISNAAPLRTGINIVDPLEYSKVDLSFRSNGLPLSYTIWSNNGLIEIKRTIAKTSSKILAGATDFTRKAAYLDLDASQANPSTGLLGGSWSSFPNFSNTIEQVGTLSQFELKKGISYKLTAEFSYLNVASGDECDFAFVDIANLGVVLGTTGGVDGGEHKRSRTARAFITPSEDITVGIEILKSSGTYSILASQNNGGTSIMVEEL